MSLSQLKFRYPACIFFILGCLYLFSGLALDSAMALNALDFANEECEILDMGPGQQSIYQAGNGQGKYDSIVCGYASGSMVKHNKASSGDVIATIMEEGKPVAGEKVYFFLAADENDNIGALFLPEFDDPGYLRSCCALQANDPTPDIVDFGRFKAMVTDANGNASFNFIRDNYINYGGLEKALTKLGCVRYYVVAYVFEEPLEQTRLAGIAPKIKYCAIAPVEINSMAAIVNVRSH